MPPSPFLSPRAQENRIRTVPGDTVNRLPRELQSGSPKGRELAARRIQNDYVPGELGQRNLVPENQTVAASPRALETFPWLASAATTATRTTNR
jgi:hypothetical protein